MLTSSLKRKRNVRIFSSVGDTHEEAMNKTYQEQQREITLLLKNPFVNETSKATLKKTNEDPLLKNNATKLLIALDQQLNTINMGLIALRLKKMSRGAAIDLHNLGLTRLPNEFIRKANYFRPIALSLKNNYLSYLPGSIAKLDSITRLDVSNNKLSALPEKLIFLELTFLNIENNPFVSLPCSLHFVLNNTQNEQYTPLLESSLNELIDTVASSTYSDNDCTEEVGRLENTLEILRRNKVSMINQATSWQTLQQLMRDQFNEIRTLLRQNITPRQRDYLTFLTFSKNSQSINLILFIDRWLDAINMSLVENLLPAPSKAVTQVNLTACGLTRLPRKLIEKLRHYPALTSLYLGMNQLCVLPEGISTLRSLALLDLRYNSLSSLPQTLVMLIVLKELRLDHNPFVHLSEHLSPVLQATQNKHFLFLISEDHIPLFELITNAQGENQQLPYNAKNILQRHIETLKHHKVRMMGTNRDAPAQILDKTIKEQKREIDSLASHLKLSATQITALQRNYAEALRKGYSIPLLITLDSQINALNMALARPRLVNTQAEQLCLNNLGLTRLPHELVEKLKTYTALMVLDVHDNQLKTLPEEVGDLRSLEVLNVSRNILISLPISLGDLWLVALNASENQLQTLPLTLVKADSPNGDHVRICTGGLKKLDISHNQFRLLPNRFSKLSSLVEFNLEHNGFTTFPLSFNPILEKTGNLKYCSPSSKPSAITIAFKALRVSSPTPTNNAVDPSPPPCKRKFWQTSPR